MPALVTAGMTSPRAHAHSPALIALDWGTSTVRAMLMGDGGRVLATESRPWGIMHTPGRDFGAAYATMTAAWRAAHPGLPAIASGMIGSAQGWVQAPYCACPASPAALASAMATIATTDGTLHVIPGVASHGATPNVMRGEETQVAGALALHAHLAEAALFVLPGTHSKWVDVQHGRIQRFDTHMTGELFAVLRDHSILGRPAAEVGITAPPDLGVAFDQAVARVRDGGASALSPLLFLCRSLVLEGRLPPQDSLDFLSGLLVGEELRSALGVPRAAPLLVGDPAACARYRRAFALFGIPDVSVLADTAPAGLWQVAHHAGLVPTPLDPSHWENG